MLPLLQFFEILREGLTLIFYALVESPAMPYDTSSSCLEVLITDSISLLVTELFKFLFLHDPISASYVFLGMYHLL